MKASRSWPIKRPRETERAGNYIAQYLIHALEQVYNKTAEV